MTSLRPATGDDCARVWAWNFAPDVRAMSTSGRGVDLGEHARWYAERLARDGSPMWIVEDAGMPVGVVRIDRLDLERDSIGHISIALARDARGRGIGRLAIAAACAHWDGPVVAQIRHDNLPSRACFEACGFAATDHLGDYVVYRLSPKDLE